MQYHVFMNSFMTCIDSANVTDASKLNRLLELCQGKARAVLTPCALGDPRSGYKRAKTLLQQRFGNDYVIIEAWVGKICNGPPIKPNNIDSLQTFTDDVRACVETLRSMKLIQEVDTRSRLVRLMQRLPEKLQDRWRRKAIYSFEETGGYPNITLFLKFLEDVTREVSDPVFGIGADRENKDNRDNRGQSKFQQHKGKYGKSLSIETDIKPDEKSYDNDVKEVVTCPLCSKDHPLYACGDFKKMSALRRVEFAKEKRLCFSCLKQAKHSVKYCKVEKICGIDDCKLKHSRFLHAGFKEARDARLQQQDDTHQSTETGSHRDANGNKSNVVSAHVSAPGKARSGGKTALPVVGVKVSASNGRSTNVYALLDSGSDRTFCSPELLKDLQIQGKPTKFTISTLNKGKKVDALEVGFTVAPLSNGFDGVCCDEIHLPEVYAIQSFPALTSSVANSSDVSQFSHLKGLPFPEVDATSVRLLIGQDNPDALVPLESRRGEKNQPYAVRTPLGWTINGPLHTGADQERSGVSNFIQFESSLYDCDVEPTLSPTRAMSVNDKKALAVWDDSVHVVDGQYMLDIPFKQVPPMLPNNKKMAERRLEFLQRKMTNNAEFGKRYRAGIQEYINDGYAEKVEDEGPIGGTWYIPHHAVVSAKKPDKFRIVFDCAAQYQGVSINNAVHRGPDFTNKMPGVLLRFREKRYVVVSDVQAMYHQVRVTPAQRDALRFLWYDEMARYRSTGCVCIYLAGFGRPVLPIMHSRRRQKTIALSSIAR